MNHGRLNKEYRRLIHDDVMRYRFTKQVQDLIAKRAEVIQALFEHFVPKKTRDLLTGLPEGTVPSIHRLSAKIGGEYHGYLYLNGGWYHNLFPAIGRPSEHETRLVPYRLYGHNGDTTTLGVLDGTHPLAEKFEEVRRETEDLQQAYNEASKRLTAELKSVHTFKRLVEQWPEIETFAKVYWQKEQNRFVPVIQREYLNDLFYLPPPKETSL